MIGGAVLIILMELALLIGGCVLLAATMLTGGGVAESYNDLLLAWVLAFIGVLCLIGVVRWRLWGAKRRPHI